MPPSPMTLHLCTLCTSSPTILCPSFSSANKTSEIERPQWNGEPFTWNANCYPAAAFALHSPNLRSWLSRGVGGPVMPPKGYISAGPARVRLHPISTSSPTKCYKSMHEVRSEGDTLQLQKRCISLEQQLSSSSTQMLKVLVSTALPPNAVALHQFGIELQCLF